MNAGVDFSCADYTAGTFTDWRLPNIKEQQSLIHFGFFDPALSNAAGTDHWTDGDAFSGVQFGFYWSSTSFAVTPSLAWRVFLHDGRTDLGSQDFQTNVVWPVRGEIIE